MIHVNHPLTEKYWEEIAQNQRLLFRIMSSSSVEGGETFWAVSK